MGPNDRLRVDQAHGFVPVVSAYVDDFELVLNNYFSVGDFIDVCDLEGATAHIGVDLLAQLF